MSAKYSITISTYPGGTATLDSIKIDGVDYPFDSPYILDSDDATLGVTLQTELNALGLGTLFSVVQGADFLAIATSCAIQEVESLATNYGSPEDMAFEVEECVAPTVTVDLTIDCENLECLTFKDTTKTPATGNPEGYGGGNYPAIADITSVLFSIVDNDGLDWQFEGSGYLPTPAGDNTICLKAENFLSYASPIVFEKGANYRLYYTLNLANGDTIEKYFDFTFPCCGDPINTNVGANFEITEKLGCSSIDFEDTTGLYNSLNNPNGYTSFPASTIIKFTKKDGSIVEVTDFTPSAFVAKKNITASVLGYADGKIPPQVMTVEYFAYNSVNCQIGYKKIRMLFHCVLRNCIVAKGQAVLTQACATTCDDAARKKTLELMLRYELMLTASYENIECIVQEVEDLYRECQKNGCC